MNTLEACSLLGISPGANDEEINKAFRKKAAELHPDTNQGKNTEDAFKKANEAYQFLKQHGSKSRFDPGDLGNINSAWSFAFGDDFFGGPFRRVNNQPKEKATVNLTFEESILGCDKDVLIARRVRCSACSGLGVVEDVNQTQCNGCRGSGTKNIFGNVRPCNNCGGSGKKHKKISCTVCGGVGGSVEERTLKVVIPAGVENGGLIRIQGQGDYLSGMGNVDAFIKAIVSPSKEFERNGDDVISILEITLLEALKGTSRKVKTVKGEKNLKLKAGIKNKDPVRVPDFGVPPNGGHVFIIDVKYPEDLGPVINALETNETNEE